MQVSKRLVVQKEVPINVSQEIELVNALDISMSEQYCRAGDFDKGLKKFREIIPKIYNEEEKRGVVNKYLNFALAFGQKLMNDQNFLKALELYRDMLNFTGFPVTVYKNIGLCMKNLGDADMAIKFLEHFEEISPDKEDVYIYLGDLVYSDIKDNKKAIGYYEKALEKYPDNFTIYNMLGHLYSTCYQDKFKEKQIYYLTKAYELAPQNRIVVKNLAYVLGKFDELAKADAMYAKLMYLNPTHSDLHAYGAYLVKHQRFSEGFKFLQHRFLKEDLGNVAFPELLKTKKKKWNMKLDISNKVILLHFEQGFGDSIMFARFIDEIKQRCKEVLFVVQKPLIPLMKDSKLGVEIYSEDDIPNLNYDYWIPLMDAPIVCETRPDTIPNTQGYLKVPTAKINAYKKQYINDNDKLKIGIAYEGTMASKETNRDIELKYFYPLMKLPDVEVYSFQVDDLTRQMDQIPPDANLIRLGKTFRDWEDTACAMNCMDLMITTDNGVMNLAGALGIKTFGLFNRITEWRWFKTDGEDLVWYKSIKPFQCPTSDDWDTPIGQIMKEVEVLRCNKVAEKIRNRSLVSKSSGYEVPAKDSLPETSADKDIKAEKKSEPKPKKKTASTSKIAAKTKTATKTKTVAKTVRKPKKDKEA